MTRKEPCDEYLVSKLTSDRRIVYTYQRTDCKLAEVPIKWVRIVSTINLHGKYGSMHVIVNANTATADFHAVKTHITKSLSPSPSLCTLTLFVDNIWNTLTSLSYRHR